MKRMISLSKKKITTGHEKTIQQPQGHAKKNNRLLTSALDKVGANTNAIKNSIYRGNRKIPKHDKRISQTREAYRTVISHDQ